MNFTDSYPELIMKGRGLLAKEFMEGDYKKVKEIKDFLEEKISDTNYIVFYPVEDWYLSYWTHEYSRLLEKVPATEPVNWRFRQKIQPPEDLLLDKLVRKTRDSIGLLESAIKSSYLAPVDRDFLLLHLKFIAMAEHANQSDTDSLNSLADKFLARYPDSKYEQFVRQFIRFELKYSDSAMDFELFSGYGILQYGLQDVFANPVPIGIALDGYYKSWVLNLRIQVGITKTRKDIAYKYGTWYANSQANIFIPDVSIGYVLVDKRMIKFAPFAGFSGMYITPVETDIKKDENLKHAEWKFRPALAAGISLDINLGKSKKELATYDQQGYWFIRVRYAYQHINFEKRHDISGSLHNFTVGFGIFGRALKRDL